MIRGQEGGEEKKGFCGYIVTSTYNGGVARLKMTSYMHARILWNLYGG